MSGLQRQWPQPVPTRYDGYRFRSKNEARWAAFYKKLGIPYRYEVDRYQLHGVTYLIDFYHSQSPCTLQLGPGARDARLTSLQQMLYLMQKLKEVEEEVLETAKETVKQYLLAEARCERQVEGQDYLTCYPSDRSFSLTDTDESGGCPLQSCQQISQLRYLLNERLRGEKPCSFTLEFDESRSPETHYWAQCRSCSAIGIFPGSFQHDVFCSINCRDSDSAFGSLENVSFDTEEDYRTASRNLVDFEATVIKEAYIAAREEPFHKKTR